MDGWIDFLLHLPDHSTGRRMNIILSLKPNASSTSQPSRGSGNTSEEHNKWKRNLLLLAGRKIVSNKKDL